MIKIVILTDSFVGAKGGSEKHIKDLVSGLDAQKYSIDIVQLSNTADIPFPSGTHESNLSYHHFPVKKVYGLSGLKTLFAISKLIRTKEIQIVLSFHEMSDILNALLPVKVIKLSSRRDMGFKRNNTLEKMIRFINRNFLLVLCPSKAVQQKVLSEGIPEEKTFLLYNGIDSESFTQALEQPKEDKARLISELGLQQDKVKLITIGNLNPWKGQRFLVDAVAIMNRRGANCQLVLFGEGDTFDALEQQVKALELQDDVFLKGYCGNVKKYLPAFDIMALPSVTEGLSNALLESAASGLPLIATDVGGNPEVVHNGINGELVPAEDAEALAGALMNYLPSSPGYSQAARASRALVEKQFSLTTMLQTYTSLFERLAGQQNRD
ncbi:glycosyltransferase [Thalassomonas viridans]|uniref:Glycosyltransferase n=1 Tax=Thalassomonas viridans TaxID=137584 RepID=A0AAE9Z2T1_9GAMM|nr:glycosyltransferase [Thalassomonas viridans]WDE05004.1 glycosyltransferase [Thalassomonas viridans]